MAMGDRYIWFGWLGRGIPLGGVGPALLQPESDSQSWPEEMVVVLMISTKCLG